MTGEWKWYPPHWVEKGPPGQRAYKRGCRCEECTAGWRERVREYRRTAGRRNRNGVWVLPDGTVRGEASTCLH